jgi:hypothetical protein
MFITVMEVNAVGQEGNPVGPKGSIVERKARMARQV